MKEKIAAGVMLLSLFAAVTNYVPISISFALLVVLVPFTYRRFFTEPVHNVLIFLVILYAYFLLSTLVYSPGALLEPGFYRRDGNFFVTYFPLLLMGLLPLKVPLEKVLKIFIPWALAALLAGYLLLPAEGPHLHHLSFISHNAAGGFTSIVFVLCIGLGLQRKNWIYLLLAAGLGFLLFETGSRGSMLAVLLALVQVLVLKERWNKIVVSGSVLFMAGLLFFTYPAWLEAGKPYPRLHEEESQEQQSALEGGHQVQGMFERIGTIRERTDILWPMALDNFFKSPLLGQGFGSYNDTPYSFTDYGFAVLNTSGEIVHSDTHAHHSFLNVMSETGLVGLALVVLFLGSLHRLIREAEIPDEVKLGMRIAFWVVVWSSFTEHRLTTPSQMLPFTILTGFILSEAQLRMTAAFPGKRAQGVVVQD